MKKIVSFMCSIVVVLFLTVCSSYADSAGATADAKADAVAVQDDHSITTVTENQKRPLVNAFPGPGAFLMTPMGAQKGVWNLFWSPLDDSFSLESIDMMRKRYTLPEVVLFKWIKRHVRIALREKPLPENNDPIVLLNWNPFKDGINPGDKKIGEVVLKGDYSWKPWPFDALLGLALAKAKEKTQTRRVFVFVRMKDKAVADGISIGTGGGIAKAMGPAGMAADNISGALAIGGLIGYTSLEMEDIEEITVMCMNDGPVVPPQKPEPPKVEPKPEAKVAPPAKQEVEVKVVIVPPLQQEVKTPETKAVIPMPAEKKVELSEFVIHFDFDKSDIRPEELSKIKAMAKWLKDHQGFRGQIEGHCSIEGSYDYNAGLGRRRGKAIDKAFKNEGVADQIIQFVSLSKDKPASDSQPENRRVIIRVIGPASGK